MPAFVAVLVLSSLPFWLLLGSVRPAGLGLLLPASALMFVCPAIVATALAAIEGGRTGAATLWRRSVDVTATSHAGWVPAAVALFPALVLLATLLDRGLPLPPSPVAPAAVLLLTPAYLAAALPEEVGWTTYPTDRLLPRLGTAPTGLVVGAIWAAWHLVPYLQVGRDARWIAWQCLGTVSARVLVVEAYTRSGCCVPLAVAMHAAPNVASAALPGSGPDLDPAPVAVVLTAAATVTGIHRTWRAQRAARRLGALDRARQDSSSLADPS
ncbi:CPBP family glutamic-type intramembrane protease [Geodermatophilus sp. URMC 61]|uniref:CPBP family glutamic-type intramembrane protease n=1 Tax=Geodermatophilus sp. URMC 61 TaxID=3423411 RepID=UPI00406D3E5E